MIEENIRTFCQNFKIKNYKINPDMSIDIYQTIFIEGDYIPELTFKINIVDGSMWFSENDLTTLHNCPTRINGNFSCSENKLTTLEYFPEYISENFYCNDNLLTTLKHLPINFHIGGDFGCVKNMIQKSVECSRLLFGYIGGDIETGFEELDEFLNKNKNPPKKDLPRLLSELRKIQL